MRRRYRWKRIVALTMAGLMLAESVPVNVYAAPVSEEIEQEETKQMFTIPIKEMATIKDGGGRIVTCRNRWDGWQ